MLVVGPKITPPWDSAAASIGRGILQALSILGEDITVVTSRVPIQRIFENYGFVPSGVHDFQSLYDNIQWYVIKHYNSQVVNETRLALVARTVSHRSNTDVAVYLGVPRNFQVIDLLVNGNKLLVLIIYTIPSIKYMMLLRYYFSKKRFSGKIIFLITSVIAYRLFRRYLAMHRSFFFPPVIDTFVFKPMNNSYLEIKDKETLRIGYVGPLIPSRFPLNSIARALVLLKRRKNRVTLHVKGLLRHGKKDWYYVDMVKRFLKSALGDNNVYVEVGQLSREELNKFYNDIDILLYLFNLSRKAELADPPLVPLEALSTGTPLIVSRGSSLDFYLSPLERIGVIKYTNELMDNLVEVITSFSLIERKAHGNISHKYISRIFSPNSVARRLKRILGNVL